MKTYILLTATFAFNFAIGTYSQNFKKSEDLGYPKISQVVVHLKNNVSSTVKKENYFNLEKSQEGYFLTVWEYNQAQGTAALRRTKIWDAATRSFVTPDVDSYLNIGDPDDSGSNWRFIQSSEKQLDFYPYYGYTDWAQAVINLILPGGNPTDYEMEVLARTYSDLSNACIRPYRQQSNFSFTANFVQPLYEELPANQLQLFLQYQDSSLLYWERLLATHPDYEPLIIRDLTMKVANEYMDTYQMLCSVKRTDLAATYLAKANYTPCQTNFIRHILSDCEQNSILLTNGDNDTYPLWYLQEKEGYRKDVQVVNVSLMQTPWYLDYIQKGLGVKMRTRPEQVIQLLSHYYVADNEGLEDWDKAVDAALLSSESADDPGKLLHFHEGVRSCTKGGELDLMVRRNYVEGQDVLLIDLVGSNCEKSVAVVSPYTWNTFDITNHNQSRGLVTVLADEVVPSRNDLTIQNWNGALSQLSINCLKNDHMFLRFMFESIMSDVINTWENGTDIGLDSEYCDRVGDVADAYFTANPIDKIAALNLNYLNYRLVNYLERKPQWKDAFVQGFFLKDGGLPANMSLDYLLDGGVDEVLYYSETMLALHDQYPGDATLLADIKARCTNRLAELSLLRTTYPAYLSDWDTKINQAIQNLRDAKK